MNGVISLVHFCELHGPTVMMSTQSVHKDQPLFSLINFSELPNNKKPKPSPNPSSLSLTNHFLDHIQTQQNLASSVPNLNYQLSNSYINKGSSLSSSNPNLINNKAKSNNCPTCTVSFKFNNDGDSTNGKEETVTEMESLGFYSDDPFDKELAYTSARYPVHPRLYAALRQACVRSLSCEFCPGREGPILFGDETHGYTLSYMFKITDSKARGSMRFYALSILMTDRLYLITSATFLILKFRALARYMQTRANELNSGGIDNIDLRKARAQSLQLDQFNKSPRSNLNKSPPPGFNNKSDSRISLLLTSDQFLKRRTNTVVSKQLQPLEELLGFPNLISFFHSSFSLILSLGARKMLESSPTPWPLWAEPTTVLIDALPMTNIGETGKSSPDNSSVVKVEHLAHLYSIIGKASFSRLIYNLVIGNQIIVRSPSATLVKDVMDVLQDVLPLLCFRKADYGTTYQPIWESNLLGLTKSTTLPSDLDLTSLVLIDIDSQLDPSNKTKTVVGSLKYGLEENKTTVFPGMVNQVLQIVEQCDCIQPPSTATTVVRNALPTFKLFSSEMPKLPAQLARLKLLALKEEWSCKGRTFAQFQQLIKFNSSIDPKTSLPNLLEIMQVDPVDLPVLRFFATAFRFKSV